MNPYQTTPSPVEQRDTERTVIVDPATGETITIGARVDRVLLDPTTGASHHEVTHVIVPAADGQELLFPYAERLYQCSHCGARPLLQPFTCSSCRAHLCRNCRVLTDDQILCPACGKTSLLAQVLSWLANL
jgi:hypothetical protein